MKILIISDAWEPQVNGVVRTLQATQRELARLGHEVRVAGPEPRRFLSFALPSYPAIRLDLFPGGRLAKILREFSPDFVHIATEGPVGWAGRRLCLRAGKPFTTSYHTSFPDYVAKRAPPWLASLAATAVYAVLRRFHTPAGAVMVATATIENSLRAHKFYRLARWSRGVDTGLFHPRDGSVAAYEGLSRPILLNVGRVAVEKNLRAFLELETVGSKVIIGDGPDLERLKADYPQARFLGALRGEELARHYAAADLFVFPSTTDTFGLVLLEACASGLRVAAYPVAGPADIFSTPECAAFAVLEADLQLAVERALALPRDPAAARQFASRFSWEACTAQFFTNLQAPSPRAKRRLLRWKRKIGEGM